jgi:hypothetical protein
MNVFVLLHSMLFTHIHPDIIINVYGNLSMYHTEANEVIADGYVLD